MIFFLRSTRLTFNNDVTHPFLLYRHREIFQNKNKLSFRLFIRQPVTPALSLKFVLCSTKLIKMRFFFHECNFTRVAAAPEQTSAQIVPAVYPRNKKVIVARLNHEQVRHSSASSSTDKTVQFYSQIRVYYSVALSTVDKLSTANKTRYI